MAQWYDPIVAQILDRSRCQDINCQCQANAVKGVGYTHCPICKQLKMWVGSENQRLVIRRDCGCAWVAVREGLRAKGINLSAE